MALETKKRAFNSACVFSCAGRTDRKGLFSKRHARPEVALPMKKGDTMPVGPQFGNAGLASEPNVDPNRILPGNAIVELRSLPCSTLMLCAYGRSAPRISSIFS